MSKKRGLGRGLDALLGGADKLPSAMTATPAAIDDHTPSAEGASQGVKGVAVDLIQKGTYQPRINFDEAALQELAESIRAQGVVQPIVVRRLDDKYELIAGERRWRAAQLAGLHEIPAVVKELDDRAAAAISLIENIQREDLNPLEEANALHRLKQEFELTHMDVAKAVGRSRAAVTNLLRLLELQPDVKEMLNARKIEMGHARAILALPHAEQLEIAKKVIAEHLTVRATEALVRKLVKNPGLLEKKSKNEKIDPNVRSLENVLTERLGAKVAIKQGAKGKGILQIHYTSVDELDGILEHIK